MITLHPFGAISNTVKVDGVTVGEAYGDHTSAFAQPAGARHGTYRFANLDDAAAACASFAAVGYWTREI